MPPNIFMRKRQQTAPRTGQNSPPQNNSCVRLRREEKKAALMIDTPRLKLMPATVALARAEIGDRGEFARLLGAVVPDNWPPETLADALSLFLARLEAAPDRVGWFGWYALAAGDAAAALVLV